MGLPIEMATPAHLISIATSERSGLPGVLSVNHDTVLDLHLSPGDFSVTASCQQWCGDDSVIIFFLVLIDLELPLINRFCRRRGGGRKGLSLPPGNGYD